MRRRRIVLAALLLAAAPPALHAAPAEPPDSLEKQGRDFSFVVMPIPISSPAVGNGLAVGALALYRMKGEERPWTTAAGGLYTDTKSWGALVGQKAYFGHDRFRVTAGVGGGEFNTEFFGIGHAAGRRGVSVPITESAKGGLAEVLVRVAPKFFIGPEIRYVDMETTLDLSQVRFPDQRIAETELDSKVVALGLAAEYDSRDSEFGPRRGVYATGVWLRSAKRLGSDLNFDRVEAAANGYHALDAKSVLAWRASVCWTGDGPFYQLCSYGQQSDLRGYQAGQYIDHAMYAVQAEYRRHLFWRLGGVVFAGFGETADSFYHMNTRDILPAGGVGLRLQASKTYKVNVRIDYAKGKGSEGFYFSIGEAF